MRAILLAAAALIVPAAAQAGDRAERTLIGFSADSSVFAFAESGVQDGSGFPYANVYFINTETGRWADTPIEVVIRDPDESRPPAVGLAVRRAMERAVPVLEVHGVDTPARLLWSHPLAEENSGDPEAHGDYPGSLIARFGQPWWNGPLTLTVAPHDMPDENCAGFGADVKGYSLTLDYFGRTAEIYRDETIPQTRGCPLGYTISDVVEGPDPGPNGQAPIVAILNVFKHGFEGPDRRFLAAPLDLPDNAR